MGRMNSKQASQIKNLGHAEETTFNALFGDKENRGINHSGASRDNVITNPKYKAEVSRVLGGFKHFSVSLKSGKTWQFHLGQLKELSDPKKIQITKTIEGETRVVHSLDFNQQKKKLQTKDFWDHYLGKKSELLCYNDKQKCYTFFKMDSVTKLIAKKTDWEILNTGRLKGSLYLKDKKYTILTFEYRADKNQFLLGACGGQNGYRLFQVLKENLNFCEIMFERKIATHEANQFQISKKNVRKNTKGKTGEMFFNENFLFLCTEENVWKKIELKKL
jgi:hypothetical protein